MIITKANEKSAEALSSLVNSAFRGESSRQGWTTEADVLDGQRTDSGLLAEWMDSPNRVILKAEEHGELKGCVSLEKLGNRARLGMLTVSPELQNRGLGRQLLIAAEKFAETQWQCSEMEMQVIEGRDSLVDWYLRCGYQLMPEKRPFPYGNPRMGLPKVQTLTFVVLLKSLNSGL